MSRTGSPARGWWLRSKSAFGVGCGPTRSGLRRRCERTARLARDWRTPLPENTPAVANSAPSGTSSGLPESPSQGFSSAPAAHTRRFGRAVGVVADRDIADAQESREEDAAVSPQPRTRAGVPGAQASVSVASTTRTRREVDRVREREHRDVVGARGSVRRESAVRTSLFATGWTARRRQVDVAEAHLKPARAGPRPARSRAARGSEDLARADQRADAALLERAGAIGVAPDERDAG